MFSTNTLFTPSHPDCKQLEAWLCSRKFNSMRKQLIIHSWFLEWTNITNYFNADSPVDGKSSFYNPLPQADLNAVLDSCSDNLLKTTLDDFSQLSSPRKDLMSPTNNNLDYFSPSFSSCPPVRMSVADCHTPPPPAPSKQSFASPAPYEASPPLPLASETSCRSPGPGALVSSDPASGLSCGLSASDSPGKLTAPPSYSCQTPVSILSNFEDSKSIPQSFPVHPQYISL